MWLLCDVASEHGVAYHNHNNILVISCSKVLKAGPQGPPVLHILDVDPAPAHLIQMNGSLSGNACYHSFESRVLGQGWGRVNI